MMYKGDFLQKNRIVRVFVSSTFQDMYEEREKLIKEIFPKFKRDCEKRGVHFCEVDLRWGVKEEQTAIPVCLSEVERSNVFIGILGERYGWIPEKVTNTELEERKWLNNYLDCSITELEITQGAFIEEDRPSFFYFGKNNKLPDSEDERSKEKLNNLKQKIINHNKSYKYYQSVEELGNYIYQDLLRLLDEKYPNEIHVNGVEKEILNHDLYAISKSQRTIKRQHMLDRLNNWLANKEDSKPLVLFGESGSGKSSLIAEWGCSLKEDILKNSNKETHILMHFIGATGHSSSLFHMVQRIVEEVKTFFCIQDKIFEQDKNIDEVLKMLLLQIPDEYQLVLILDAVNQLDSIKDENYLNWLPEVIPDNVKLVLSTTNDEIELITKKRDYSVLEVTKLSESEIVEMIQYYFEFYGKNLPDNLTTEISKHLNSSNPLFLSTLLEELRIHGSYDTLKETTVSYLESQSINELYEKILIRLEQDYGHGDEKIVHSIMSMLWSSRRGLYEEELLSLVGTKESPLPQAFWSPVHHAIEGTMISRMGQLNFSHDFFRTAIEKRYLSSEEEKNIVYTKLIEYFNCNGNDKRKLEELPWLYIKTKKWNQLYDLLADMDTFSYLWKQNSYELIYFWEIVEINTRYSKKQLTVQTAYEDVIENPDNYLREKLEDLVSFMYQKYPNDSMKLIDYLISNNNQNNDIRYYTHSTRKAEILLKQGKYDEALLILRELEQFYRVQNNKLYLQAILGNMAEIYFMQGLWEKATIVASEQQEISNSINYLEGLINSYSILGKIKIYNHLFLEGLALFNKQLDLAEKLARNDVKAGVFCNLIDAYLLNHQVEKAEEFMNRLKELPKRELSPFIEQEEYYLSARIHESRANYDNAISLLEEQKIVCSNIHYYPGLVNSYGLHAKILQKKIDKSKIKKQIIRDLYNKQEKICRDFGLLWNLQSCLNNKANFISKTPSMIEEFQPSSLLEEQISICKQINFERGIYNGYDSLIKVCIKNIEYEKANDYIDSFEALDAQVDSIESKLLIYRVQIYCELGEEKRNLGKQLLLILEKESIENQDLEKYHIFLVKLIRYLEKDGLIHVAYRLINVLLIHNQRKERKQFGDVRAIEKRFNKKYRKKLRETRNEIVNDTILSKLQIIGYISDNESNELPFFDNYIDDQLLEDPTEEQVIIQRDVGKELTIQQRDLVYLLGIYDIHTLNEYHKFFYEQEEAVIQHGFHLTSNQSRESLLNDLVDKSVVEVFDVLLSRDKRKNFKHYQLSEKGKELFESLAPSLQLSEKIREYSLEEEYYLEELTAFFNITPHSFYHKIQEDIPKQLKEYFPKLDGVIIIEDNIIPIILSYRQDDWNQQIEKIDYMYCNYGQITILSYDEDNLYFNSKHYFWNWIIDKFTSLNNLPEPITVQLAHFESIKNTGILKVEKLIIVNQDIIEKEFHEIELVSKVEVDAFYGRDKY